jgi:hypothetical protein
VGENNITTLFDITRESDVPNINPPDNALLKTNAQMDQDKNDWILPWSQNDNADPSHQGNTIETLEPVCPRDTTHGTYLPSPRAPLLITNPETLKQNPSVQGVSTM